MNLFIFVLCFLPYTLYFLFFCVSFKKPMGYFLRFDSGLGPSARKHFAGACQGLYLEGFGGFFKAVHLACFRGSFRKPLWPFFVHAFVRNPYKFLYGIRTKFCTDSVQKIVRIPYTILYGFSFFFASARFSGSESDTDFWHGFRPLFCTDSVQFFVRIPYTKATECEPARTDATLGVRSPCTDSVQKSVRIPYKKVYGIRPKNLVFGARGQAFSGLGPRVPRGPRASPQPSAARPPSFNRPPWAGGCWRAL